MPNAAGVKPLGDLFRMRARRSSARQPVSAMWITRRASFAPLRSLPAKTSALAASGERLVSVSDYMPPLSLLVHQLKFTRRSEIAAALARLLLQEVLMARRSTGLQLPDRIVSVPLWSRRHWRRGFNQSDLLCQPLARWLGCAWDSQTITRVRATATQHHLSARLRKRNLKNAFRLELPVQGLHMVIVDDVVTTGSTVAEIAQLLLRNGAATVQVWCLCRTL